MLTTTLPRALVKQAVFYQQPNLPDVEAYLHVQYSEVISKLEKKMANDPEFSCCSCERLMQRKQVTTFKFSGSKFSLNMWRMLKDYISKGNSSTANDTHYVCFYCRVRLSDDDMPSRCMLNRLVVEPVPPEFESLDPLGKQMIQWAKAFEAVYRLGTYTGKVPSHTSVKACKGTMFFLPLPLDKTMDTVEEIDDLAKGKLALLPNPELYIIVNSKGKSNKTIWQNLVSVDKLKAAVRKLKATLWLYVDVDESSLDEASWHMVKTVSEATSIMLEKVSSDKVSSYQSYTVRQLNSKQSSLPDTEHYKLVNVKEDPLSNKLKYLDELCFPTLFPTGRFGKSHPRQQRITPSEFVKSRLMNKDGYFRKEDQYVFYLLWQKEMRELASGIYNLLKGTWQHPMQVRDFVDRVATNEEHIEASLSTVFQNMRGSN